jgi:hypothetical protein
MRRKKENMILGSDGRGLQTGAHVEAGVHEDILEGYAKTFYVNQNERQ